MSEGIFIPDYTLSQFTKKAIKDAGVGGDSAAAARKHLNKAQTLGNISGAIDTVGKQADQMARQIKAKNAAEDAAKEKARIELEAAQALEAEKDRIAEQKSLDEDDKKAQIEGDKSIKEQGQDFDAYIKAEKAYYESLPEDWKEKGYASYEQHLENQEKLGTKEYDVFDQTDSSDKKDSAVPFKSPVKFLEGTSGELPAFDEADANWKSSFDKMSDRQSWASPELYSQFQQLERAKAAEHLQAVRNKDKAGAAKILAEQSQRASNLKDWQQTMTTAMQINKDHGWNIILEGDDDEAKANRRIVSALAANDGTAKVAIDDSGEMGFTLGQVDPTTGRVLPDFDPMTGQPIGNPKIYLHREIDELISVATWPVDMQQSFQNGVLEAQALGNAGGEFNVKGRNNINKNKIKEKVIKNPKNARWILHDVWAGGETTLAEDIMQGQVVQNMGFKVKIPKTFGTWTRPLPQGQAVNDLDVNGDGYLTAADFTNNDVARILQELEKPEHNKLLAEIAGDWMTRKEQNVYAPAKANYDAQQEQVTKRAEADKVSKMNKQQRDDYYRTLGDTSFSGKTAAEKLEYYRSLRAEKIANS